MKNIRKSFPHVLILSLALVYGSCAHQQIFTAPDLDLSEYVPTEAKAVTGKPSGITEDQLISLVDPFVGTAGHGHTFPGATMPFGMVQVSPDNGIDGWDWCSGYHWFGSEIEYISHKHLSGTGGSDLGDIGVLPSITGTHRKASFSHDNEYAHPGYYAVKLDNNIVIELTASKRGAIHRYQFPKGAAQTVLFSLQHYIGGGALIGSDFDQVDEYSVSGYRGSRGWAKKQRCYFAARFSRPIQSIRQGRVKSEIRFNSDDEMLEMQIALSTVSAEAAFANLKEELDGLNFDQVKVEAESRWEAELSKIRIESSDESVKRTFYAALYHSFIAPNLLSDVDGRYSEPDGSVTQCEGYQRYSTFSLWDTYRAAHPLFVLTQPQLTVDFIESMMDHYDQRGFLPIWELEANETFCMIGNHSVPVIAEAWLKGIQGFDIERAYQACYDTLMQNARSLDDYRELGFVPWDKEGESVSKTLEYCYNDWCMAKLADSLGKSDDFKYFGQRALSYMNLFDKETQLMRPKNSNGQWLANFDPFAHQQGANRHYTEGNAWQYSWAVQHDIPGLISLFGSEENFIKQFDQLFELHDIHSGSLQLVDVTGLIGQYAQGNEPSHHVAYIYNWTEKPWRTQELINQICQTFYHDRPDGYCGNEDCGQMSAWYLFSAMGFYPVDPVSGDYSIGSPQVDSAEITLANGKIFKMVAENNNFDSPYIQKVLINGKAVDRLTIRYDEIMQGVELRLVMGPEPVK